MGVKKVRIILSPLLQIVKLHPQNLSGPLFLHLQKEGLKPEDEEGSLFSTNKIVILCGKLVSGPCAIQVSDLEF